VTLEELRQLREANPDAYRSNIQKVRVDNDRPSSPGVWQNGCPPPGYVPKPVRDAE
jgi:hypothetical protein